MAYEKKKEYLVEGVVATFDTAHKGVFVERKPLKSLTAYPATPNVFTPFRLIINIGFFRYTHPKRYINRLTPAVKLRLRFKQSDLDEAKKLGKALKCAWWNGNVWVLLDCKKTYSASAHWAGFCDVDISDWGDPPVAWGT